MSIPSLDEYLSPAAVQALMKLAEQPVSEKPEKKERTLTHTIGRVLAANALFGAATAAGYGLGRLADKAYEKVQGRPIPRRMLPILGAVGGLGMRHAYNLYKAHELEELQRAVEAKRNHAQRGVPGQ